jgi:putative transposase
MAALALGGLSSRTLAMMSKRILGVNVSHELISKSLPMLQENAESWLQRPIEGEWWALLIDGSNFKVRRRGSVEKEPSLVVLAIDSTNRRSILAIEPGTRDSAECWRTVFRSLINRGLDPSKVRIGVMDGLPGLEKVFAEEFQNAVTARCWFHAMQNVLAKTPKRLKDAFHKQAKAIMYAESESDARAAFRALKETMNTDCSRAISCLANDLDSLVSHYQFPKAVWQSLKTTNAVERIHKEVKRRTRAMEGVEEGTLTSIRAFTALRFEMSWQRRAVDTYKVDHLIGKALPKVDLVAKLQSVPLNIETRNS